MNAAELQTFLHDNIPATAALGIEILQAEESGVALAVPFAPNRNHKNTAFGGSIALGATVCGWAWVHCRFPEAGGNIVIQQGEARYLRPARGNLTIQTCPAPSDAWLKMEKMFAERGKGKIELDIEILAEGEVAAVFKGTFVALK